MDDGSGLANGGSGKFAENSPGYRIKARARARARVLRQRRKLLETSEGDTLSAAAPLSK